jgi:hypothetical protein
MVRLEITQQVMLVVAVVVVVQRKLALTEELVVQVVMVHLVMF